MKYLFLLLLSFYSFVTVSAQDYSFDVSYKGKNYTLTVRTSSNTIVATSGGQTVFNFRFYEAAVNDEGRIAFSFRQGSRPQFSASTTEKWLCIRSDKIGCNDPATAFYNFEPRNTTAFESKYNSLKTAIQNPSTSQPSINDNISQSSRTFTVKGVSFKMIPVSGGSFTMGATSEQGSDANDDEKLAHRVTLSGYMIGETEVTQELWQAVMGNNPSYCTGNLQRPVEMVSWNECQDFIRKLNNLTGQSFRLPTEAEWEYAARGGNKSNGYKYAGSNTIDNVAWYRDNGGHTTHPVKTKSPNEQGIYDMSGNVWEWCSDWYGSGYYQESPSSNPRGPSSGSYRVFRGGSWNSDASDCRVSARYYYDPVYLNSILGLRLVL